MVDVSADPPRDGELTERGRPDGPQAQERALIAAAVRGDRLAFGALYEEHADRLFRFVRAQVQVAAVAEDIVSETFLRAWGRIDGFEPETGVFAAWLFTIARNLVRDRFKSLRFRRELLDGETYEIADGARGPEQLALERLDLDRLGACLAQLSADQRECVLLRFVSGLSLAETAEVMHRNANAVKQLQHRAVRQLAVLMRG